LWILFEGTPMYSIAGELKLPSWRELLGRRWREIVITHFVHEVHLQ
jgi:hypothetical protein